MLAWKAGAGPEAPDGPGTWRFTEPSPCVERLHNTPPVKPGAQKLSDGVEELRLRGGSPSNSTTPRSQSELSDPVRVPPCPRQTVFCEDGLSSGLPGSSPSSSRPNRQIGVSPVPVPQQRLTSCRNRHCPSCQSLARAAWIEDRTADLLDTEHFHFVFTVPRDRRDRRAEQGGGQSDVLAAMNGRLRCRPPKQTLATRPRRAILPIGFPSGAKRRSRRGASGSAI